MDVDPPEKVKEEKGPSKTKGDIASLSAKTSFKSKSKETKKRNLDLDEAEADTEIQPIQKKQKKSKK